MQNINLPLPLNTAIAQRKKEKLIGALSTMKLLKKGVWLYFILLIFEGALRKWFLPALSTPLLIVRDPIALGIVWIAWKRGLLHLNPNIIAIWVVTAISIVFSMTFGHKNPMVAFYGARVFLFHFPLIYAIGKIFDRNDVIQLGRITLWIAVPMVILIALQFYSPQSAWVNRGVGGSEEGAGFSGALGYFRPPGTFSFTNGNGMFFGFVGAYVLYFWLNPGQVNKALLVAATLAVLASISLSISRTLFFELLVSLSFAVIGVCYKPKYIGRMVMALLGITLALAVLSQTEFFQTATEAFTHRFETANENEGGLEGVLGDRYMGGMVGAIAGVPVSIPLVGFGIGMGTNVGAMLLTGDLVFLISEEEWGRLIGEMGAPLGILIIIIRLKLCYELTLACFRRLKKGDLLPWMLLSFCLLCIPQGQWGQPTALGFGTMVAGLVIASLRTPRKKIHFASTSK
ncbi:hypothetical protein [Desertivirga arenae]|uniref:hypothetical protein n=1 Tax=Desertivirga arenae TaxID=2810309 RepID=UPI001A96FFA3|nr:hypothetical protein [Pedobacter sp. SYSU D00823]